MRAGDARAHCSNIVKAAAVIPDIPDADTILAAAKAERSGANYIQQYCVCRGVIAPSTAYERLRAISGKLAAVVAE